MTLREDLATALTGEEVDYNVVNWQAQLTSKIHRDLYPLLDPYKNQDLAVGAAGKTVLITGATGGIGRTIAEAWVVGGAKGIVMTDLDSSKLRDEEQRLGALSKERSSSKEAVKLLSIAADITDERSVAALWTTASQSLGRIDVLINCAGSLTVQKIGEGLPGDIWKHYETNVKGPMFMTHHFLNQPGFTGGTVILITTGILGETYPSFASYIPSKLAAAKYMEYLHAEQPNVRCFSVIPGLVASNMAPKEYIAMARDDPMLTGGLSLLLCTERAEWLRGGLVSVNWDLEEMEEHKNEIVEKRLIKLGFTNAKFGKGGHPWEEQP
jgi:NAD(P)-dependent dehydrogenase (short-subunit alcohol dehydrogenase family)